MFKNIVSLLGAKKKVEHEPGTATSSAADSSAAPEPNANAIAEKKSL